MESNNTKNGTSAEANSTNSEQNWKKFRADLKAKWPSLKDAEIDTLKGNTQSLAAQLKRSLSFSEDKAQTESALFLKNYGNLGSTKNELPQS